MAPAPGALSTLVSGLDHPEGVCSAPDGHVYASGERGQVYRVDLAANSFKEFAATGGFGLGLAADAGSNLYVCDMGVKAVVRVRPDGSSDVYSRGAPGEEFTVPNYPVFDAAGNLYVSNSGTWDGGNGSIQRIAPDGRAVVWSRAAAGFTNGMALSPDGRFLYVVESNPPLISRIAIAADGTAGAYEVVAALPRVVPDGIAFDTDGRLYVACFTPDRIYRIAPGGEPEVLFDDWVRILLNAPTNLCFAGNDLDRLVIASLGGWDLSVADVGARGAPLQTPRMEG